MVMVLFTQPFVQELCDILDKMVKNVLSLTTSLTTSVLASFLVLLAT